MVHCEGGECLFVIVDKKAVNDESVESSVNRLPDGKRIYEGLRRKNDTFMTDYA